MRATSGTPLGDVYDPYFNRTFEHFCSHQHTPPQPEASGFHAGVEHGPVTHLAHPLFGVYAGYGQVTLRQHLGRVIDRMLGGTPTVSTSLPSTGRVVLTRQPNESTAASSTCCTPRPCSVAARWSSPAAPRRRPRRSR